MKFCLEIVCLISKNQLGSPLFPQGFRLKLLVARPPQEQRASVLSVMLWDNSWQRTDFILSPVFFSTFSPWPAGLLGVSTDLCQDVVPWPPRTCVLCDFLGILL